MKSTIEPLFLGGSVVKNPPANAGDADLIPGLGRSLEEGNGNPLQYSHLGNLMDRGAWQATVHGLAESEPTEHLSTAQQSYLLTNLAKFLNW